jgi:selenoprotein W-related protein
MLKPRLEIHYCPKCRWVLRATWLAQEILFTFPEHFREVALIANEPGTFDVKLEDTVLFSRKDAGRFPETKELKQAIRDLIEPDRDLGHSDRK